MDDEYESKLSNAVHTGLHRLANAITTPGTVAGTDAAGIQVESLTEAVMGMTASLVRLADAMGNLAKAMRTPKRKRLKRRRLDDQHLAQMRTALAWMTEVTAV